MEADALKRGVVALLVVTVGIVYVATFVADVFDSSQPLVGRLLSAYSILIVGVLIVGAGWFLYDDSVVDRPLRVAGWCLAGTVMIVFVEWLMALEHAINHGDLAVIPSSLSLHVTAIGSVAGFLLGVYEDNRLRQYRTEQRIRNELESVFTASMFPLIVLDEGGRIQRWNEAATQLYGWSENEVLGKRPPMEAEGKQNIFDDRKNGLDGDGPITESIVTIRTKTGDQIEVRQSITRIRSDEGFRGYLVIAQDITDQQRRKRELERSRDLLVKTEQIADIGGWELDLQTDELYITEGTRAIYDLPGDCDLDFDTAMEFVNPDSRSSLRESIDRCRRTGTPYEHEFQLTTYEGREKWVQARGEAVTEGDNPVALRGTIQNVTTQNRRRQQLQVLHRVLRHNIRNNLNVIMGRADLIHDELDSSDAHDLDASNSQRSDRKTASLQQRDAGVSNGHGSRIRPSQANDPTRSVDTVYEHLRAIREKSENLVSISDKASRFDQITDQAVGPRTTTSILALFEEVQSKYPDAKIKIICPNDIVAYGNPSHLELAVDELVQNALNHAANESSPVKLTASESADVVILRVIDTGPGLSEYERRVVTNGDETKLIHGSGIGLWIVKWIVMDHGGAIRFEDNTPRGTVVTLKLPATYEQT